MRVLKIFKQFSRAKEVFRCFQETSQWLPLTLAYVGVRPLRYPYRVTLRDGCWFELADFYDTATFWQVFFHRVYPVKPDDRVIIDAGGNVGSFSLYALRAAVNATVVAVEPFPASFERMRKLIEGNGLSSRFIPVQAALGAHSGSSLIEADDRPSQFRRVTSNAEVGVPVPTITLEQLCRDLQIDHVDYLKMDIEGGEYPALLSASADLLRLVKSVGLEYHPLYTGETHSPRELFDHLEQADLENTLHREDGEGYGVAQFARKAR